VWKHITNIPQTLCKFSLLIVLKWNDSETHYFHFYGVRVVWCVTLTYPLFGAIAIGSKRCHSHVVMALGLIQPPIGWTPNVPFLFVKTAPRMSPLFRPGSDLCVEPAICHYSLRLYGWCLNAHYLRHISKLRALRYQAMRVYCYDKSFRGQKIVCWRVHQTQGVKCCTVTTIMRSTSTIVYTPWRTELSGLWIQKQWIF